MVAVVGNVFANAIKGGGKLYLVTLEGSDYDQRSSTYEITLISTQ